MTHKTIAASASQSCAGARFGIKHLGTALLLCALLLAPVAQAQTSTRQISLPNQDYTESTEDLVVKVLGGQVVINRTWTWGKWYLNDRWADLVLQPDPLGGVLAVSRADRIYTRVGSGGAATYSFDENNYVKAIAHADGQVSGWQWYDREGNTIDYDAAGRMLGWANQAGVKVSLERDAQGQISGVKDHQGRQALTVEYSAGLPVKVSDASGRSVRYDWSLPAGAPAQLTQVTDARGGVWRYTYNAAGYIQSRTDPEGGQISLSYMTQPARLAAGGGSVGGGSSGSAGSGGGGSGGGVDTGGPRPIGSTKISIPPAIRVASLTDEVGAATNYRIDYDRVRREYLVGIQQPGGTIQNLRYDIRGRLLQDTLDGVDRSIVSQDSPTQERITDARGLVTTIQYDSAAARRPIKTIHPDGSQESSTYDPIYNRRTSHTNALGIVSTWAYDAKGNVTEYVEAKGKPEQRTTRYTYDQYGQMLTRTRGTANGQGADAITERYEYDDRGNITKATDGLGNSTAYTYNLQGQPLTQTNALNQTTSYTYDAAGNLTQSTNALNETTRYSYDGRGRRTQTVSAAGRTQTVIYDKAGRMTETRLPGQSQGVRTQYDQAGRPIQRTSAGGLVTKSSYDSQGRLTRTEDPAGNATTYEYGAKGEPLAGLLTTVNYPTYKETYQYDQRNRQTAVTQHLGSNETRVQRQGYDANGQRITSTDPAGKSTLYQYDGLGRLTQTTDALGNATKQTWDAQDNLLTLADAKGNQHKFDYDKANRLTKETRPLGGAIQYSYDAAGNPAQRTDAGGNTRSYTYNAAGRMTQEVHKLGGSTTDQQISYSHDADGQTTGYEQKDGSGSLISSASYTLDVQGRTGTSSVTYGKVDGGTVSFTIGQSFNADGQLASHIYPDGSTQSYSYSGGRLAKVTLPNGSEISYGSYSWMVPQQIQTPGATKSLGYDPLQRPTSIEVKNASAQLLAKRLYQYDAAGNITEIESDLGKTTYGYDQLDRLTQATPDNALQVLGLPQEQYSYDPVGNRTSSGHQPGAWAYNADNQMTQYPRLVPFSGGAPTDTQISYTAQGHTKQETSVQGTKDYGYSVAERLIRYANTPKDAPNPSLEASYRYDPFGRRIAKSVKEGASTSTTYFVYGDSGLMGEANEQGQLAKSYGFNPNATQQGLWSTDPIWQANASNGSLTDASTSYHYLHTDHLGTPTLATDKSGATTWKAVSEAFGAAGALPESRITMNLRFPGQYFDSETGTHYNYFRNYNPYAGRYLQSDPLKIWGGINLFEYSGGDPVRDRDSMGLAPDICRGPDCSNPPYDPTPDGPKPSPNKSPKKDRGYEGWMEKCVDEVCETIKADTFTGWCQQKGCKLLTKWACKRAGTNHNCCDCVMHRCVSSMGEKGMPDEAARAYCESNRLLCMSGG
ncbi:MAG: RHS repeat-associated core domain-containing protein [Ottowia sp.]|uniref:RHS repeat-associated core domain-containing protein n=1 Tax=Ottowia sp. TaxID=1898956 RepID=UPI0039E4B920